MLNLINILINSVFRMTKKSYLILLHTIAFVWYTHCLYKFPRCFDFNATVTRLL